LNTENRIFTDVFTNGDAALLFAPVRVFQIEPKCGPSKGGTKVKVTGTGFSDSDKLSMRFTFAGKTTEVPCYFDESDCSFVCTTPQFAQSSEELKLPCDCFISVTLDGTNFSECEESFKIYSDEIFLTSVYPKCGSIAGGS
jgi:Zn-finger protein